MERKNTAVFGLYATPATAEGGVDHLLTLGFNNQAISVLMPDDETTRAFAHEKNTKAPEGTAAGAATGGACVVVSVAVGGLLTMTSTSTAGIAMAVPWPDGASAKDLNRPSM